MKLLHELSSIEMIKAVFNVFNKHVAIGEDVHISSFIGTITANINQQFRIST